MIRFNAFADVHRSMSMTAVSLLRGHDSSIAEMQLVV